MSTNDKFLEKVHSLNNKLLKLILEIYSINNFYDNKNLKKPILELKNNIDSSKGIESVVYDSINQSNIILNGAENSS